MDAHLDALYEGREQDEVPDEAPMSESEIEAMATFFAEVSRG